MEINFYLSTIIVTLIVVSSNIWKTRGQDANLVVTTTPPTGIKPVSAYPYETAGFDSSNVRSGPILIIDKKTIFISNINYDASQNSNFLVGTGKPPAKSTLVPDENNSTARLHAYIGRNIYLQLPGNLTTDQIDYLTIWSKENNKSLGDVMLYINGADEVRKNIPEALGFHQKTEDGQTIFRVPKCCKLNDHFRNKPSDCESVTMGYQTNVEYKVFESNETHIDPDRFMENIAFIPYPYKVSCGGRGCWYYQEDSEEGLTMGLIYNSSLIYKNSAGYGGILPHDMFCMDHFEKLNRTIFLFYAPEEPEEMAIYTPQLYMTLLVISTCCFFFSAICYVVILKMKDVHQKCFVGYSSHMTITFLCLILLQYMSSGCNSIGSLFLFSILCSIMWLTCLCGDLIFLIKPINIIPDDKRFTYYLGLSHGIPLIILISSVASDGVPDIPNSFIKMYPKESPTCSFKDVSLSILFVPSVLLILGSLAALCYTSYLINSKNNSNDYDWVRNKSNFKFMLRSCFLVLTTTCLSLLEAIVSIIQMGIGLQVAVDLIEASQGLFVLFIFVLNKYTRKKIARVLRKQDKDKYNGILENLRPEATRLEPKENEPDDHEHGKPLTGSDEAIHIQPKRAQGEGHRSEGDEDTG